MAHIKTWIVAAVGVSYGKIEVNATEDVEVEAHSMTIEPSGALTFWHVTPNGMISTLLFAFAPSEWRRVTIKQAEPAVE